MLLAVGGLNSCCGGTSCTGAGDTDEIIRNGLLPRQLAPTITTSLVTFPVDSTEVS
jgi:hypothetical protein